MDNRLRLVAGSLVTLLAAGFTYYATGALPYYPAGWRWLIVLAVAALGLAHATNGVLLAQAAILLPIAYTSVTLAVVYLLLLAIGSLVGAFGSLVVAVAVVTLFQKQLAALLLLAPLLAGFAGRRRGAVLGGLACLWTELLTLLAGRSNSGPLVVGPALGQLAYPRLTPVSSLLDFSWFKQAAAGTEIAGAASSQGLIQTALLSRLFTPFLERPVLLAQMALWALAAAVVSALLSGPPLNRVPARIVAVAGGAAVLLIGHVALPDLLLGSAVPLNAVLVAVLVPAAAVALAAPLLEALPVVLSEPAAKVPEAGEATARKGVPADAWEELAGVDDIKAEALQAIESQFNPKVRASLLKMSIRPTRGILLYGPPGTGKTKMARCIAHDARAAFFAVSGTEFTSKWYGESEANLRGIFEEARRSRPSVLFFDELEAFLPKRTELSRSDAPEKGIVGTFLAYTDGIGELEGVLLVAATNYPDLIDPAALRPGRFDKLIYVSPPDLAARRGILERYMKDKPLAPDVDMDKLAQRTERFTGADIQSLCAEAVRAAMQGGGGKPAPVTMSDLETAMGGIRPSVTIKMLREYEALADQFGRRSEKPPSVEVVSRPALTWDDVAGLEQVKEALREAIELPLAHPETLKQYGVKGTKGVLLFGPPGCGKTFLAKVVASQADAHFLHVKGPELLKQATGGSEEQLRDVFIRARENAPCVLFFDEIDALAGTRGTAEASGTKILTQFLTEMDGVEELRGVVVVAATNRPDTLDPALLRPGRFDRILYVPLPDRTARIALFKKELAGKPLGDDIAYESLADGTDGYSAADIASICNAAAMAAARESLRSSQPCPVSMRHLQEQIPRTPRSTSPEQLAVYEALRDRLQR